MSAVLKNKKVVVFGLLPKQQKTIEQEYGDFFDLSFNKDSIGSVTSDLSKSSDVIILMVRFMSHRQKKALDREKCLYCTGGLTSLRKMLDSLKEDQKEKSTKKTKFLKNKSSKGKIVKHIEANDMPFTSPEDFILPIKMVLSDLEERFEKEQDEEVIIDLVGDLKRVDFLPGDFGYDDELVWRKNVRKAAVQMKEKGELNVFDGKWSLISR